MNTFGTKIGLDSSDEEAYLPVDNHVMDNTLSAIMDINEDITS